MLAIALADLAGLIDLETATAALSDFADHALDLALADIIGDAPGFAVIALGKHGSRELNYSSDIDPILIFDPDTLPRRPRDEPIEAAVRIARRLVDLLQTRDGNGFVFRVDLRLRPASEATPIAIPVDAAIAHYESSALGWERAAFIRSRAAAGDRVLGNRFLETIRPFVWRRSLDYGAVGELQALTASIRSAHGAARLGPGYDVKRGRGGIREIEFYAQSLQMVHGGRDASLRAGATMSALAALDAAGRIPHEIASSLADAYRVLRTVEHGLQLVDDRQTHELPRGDALDGVAGLLGLRNGDALIAALAPHVAFVEQTYDALDTGSAVAMPADEHALSYELEVLGFADVGAAMRRIGSWRAGGIRALRSGTAMTAFEAVLRELLVALATAPSPDDAIARFDQLLGKLSSGINLFRLLGAQPALLAVVVDIVSHAPPLADAMARHPALLDRLIDRTAFDPICGLGALIDEMAASGSPVEIALDRVRQVVGEYRFMLGCQIVTGTGDPLEVGRGYARVAEAAIATVARAVSEDFERAHGRVPDSELLVLALGRLGGGLMTSESDLDLIFLFSGDYRSESDGARPLGATHYYNRLAQRMIGGLSVATSAGALYEVDTRLRPNGDKGPLVVSLDSFERYQREEAWTWEHMALTRARVLFGSPGVRAATEVLIGQVLKRSRDRKRLAVAVAAMRDEIAQHKPPGGALDVKLMPGGLVDLEFAIQFNQLADGIGLSPDLAQAIAAVEPKLATAYDLLTRMVVTLRLVAPGLDDPGAATRPVVVRACGAADWDDLLARLDVARQGVACAWERVVAEANAQ